jgi:hypothetical protein
MTPEKPHEGEERIRKIPTASAILDSGELVELVFDPGTRVTQFVVGTGNGWSYKRTVDLGRERLVPFSPSNNLLAHEVVLFPSEPEEYGSDAKLLRSIRDFIHRFVDVSPLFEELASYYVLLTWIYDQFNELPYLRVRGDYGSGKTRFLLIVGSLCYKPIFASGASTVSPLFRVIDTFRGTLVMDESDFRLSDERAEIVKILNNGNARGFPVLRTEILRTKELDPRAYTVFGPKIVATRSYFEDRALESRCLTEDMGQKSLRDDVPLNLPDVWKEAARMLRNRLLLFRLRNFQARRKLESAVDRRIEPRLNQIFAPLMAVMDDNESRAAVRQLLRRYHADLVSDRGMGVEAQLLEAVKGLLSSEAARLSVADIAISFSARFGEEFIRPITPKWVGTTLRRRLGLKPSKSRGVYILGPEELAKLPHLFDRYGLAESPGDDTTTQVDKVDMGDVAAAPAGAISPISRAVAILADSAPSPTQDVPEVPDVYPERR